MSDLARRFGALAGQLDNAMTVVTVADGSSLSGCLVGFSTQCSIDPPRYLVCISRRNHTHGPASAVAARGGVLAVHFLDATQHDLARHFGELTGDDTDKFTDVSWTPGPDGVPLLTACRHHVVGRVRERVEVGDHTTFLLDVEHVATAGPLDPLGQQAVLDLEPGPDA